MPRVSPDNVILGLLEAQSCHGYQLLTHFRAPERLGRIWKLSTSRIYTLLKQLERREWIDGREEDVEDAPMRTVYWLTDAGRKRLYQWLDDPAPDASTRNIRTEFLSRLYIAQVLGRSAQPIISVQRDACLHRLAQLEAQARQSPACVGDLVLSLQMGEMRWIVEWLATCEESIETLYEADFEDLLIGEDGT